MRLPGQRPRVQFGMTVLEAYPPGSVSHHPNGWSAAVEVRYEEGPKDLVLFDMPKPGEAPTSPSAQTERRILGTSATAAKMNDPNYLQAALSQCKLSETLSGDLRRIFDVQSGDLDTSKGDPEAIAYLTRIRDVVLQALTGPKQARVFSCLDATATEEPEKELLVTDANFVDIFSVMGHTAIQHLEKPAQS